MTTAQTFYGSSYDKAKDPAKLESAYRFLEMAIRAEAEGEAGKNKANMAFNAALRNEAEAFA